MLYRYRAGIPWRDLPEQFGDFRVIHTRHTRWSKGGVWKRVVERLAEDPDNEYALIDSTLVRAHQHAAGAQGGSANRKRSGAARAGVEANTIIADKACDADERVIQPLQRTGKTIVIPSKSNRKPSRGDDEDLYRARHLVSSPVKETVAKENFWPQVGPDT